MRSVIDLPDALETEAGARAQERTFTSLVEEALRAALAEEHSAVNEAMDQLPAFGGPDDEVSDRSLRSRSSLRARGRRPAVTNSGRGSLYGSTSERP